MICKMSQYIFLKEKNSITLTKNNLGSFSCVPENAPMYVSVGIVGIREKKSIFFSAVIAGI